VERRGTRGSHREAQEKEKCGEGGDGSWNEGIKYRVVGIEFEI
jgi:hypothetical protein